MQRDESGRPDRGHLSGQASHVSLPVKSKKNLGDLVEATCQARSPECMSVAWRLRHRRCCLLELGCRSQRIFCVWLHCQSVLLGTRDPQRGTREPTCSVRFFFFPRPSPALGDSLANLSLSLSLSLSLLLPPPPARLPLLATCLPPLAAPSPPSFPKRSGTFPDLGQVSPDLPRARVGQREGSVPARVGCSLYGLLQS